MSIPSPTIRLTHLNHINIVVDGFAACVAQLTKLFGAEFILDLPQKEWHAGLLTLSDIMFEIFAPWEFLTNAKYGPHFVGIEYVVPNVDEAREELLSNDIRIVRDIGTAIHTHPADTFGITFELFDKNFHAEDVGRWNHREAFRPIEYWRDEHPLGCLGLKRCSAVMEDGLAAVQFLRDFAGATVVYEERRLPANAYAIGLQLADSVLEVLTPDGNGRARDQLIQYGNGLRATVLKVANIDAARKYFERQGCQLEPGDADGTFAVPRDHSCGVLFEVSE